LRIATVYVAPARAQASLATTPFGIATTFFAQIAISEPVAAHPRTLDLGDEAGRFAGLGFAGYRSAERRRAGTMHPRLPN
jgi:hypothetical protein